MDLVGIFWKYDKAYCKYCVSFSGKVGGVGKQTIDNLVKKPFNNWKDAFEVFNSHTNCEYHRTYILKRTCAKQILGKNVDYINKTKRKIIENRKNLISVIKTIIFMADKIFL